MQIQPRHLICPLFILVTIAAGRCFGATLTWQNTAGTTIMSLSNTGNFAISGSASIAGIATISRSSTAASCYGTLSLTGTYLSLSAGTSSLANSGGTVTMSGGGGAITGGTLAMSQSQQGNVKVVDIGFLGGSGVSYTGSATVTFPVAFLASPAVSGTPSTAQISGAWAISTTGCVIPSGTNAVGTATLRGY